MWWWKRGCCIFNLLCWLATVGNHVEVYSSLFSTLPMQELVIEYANGVLLKAMDIASTRGKAKPPLKGIGAVTAEDILAVVQKDRKKVDRVKDLFDMQKEIREMRAVTDTREDMLDVDALKSLAKEIEND